MTTQNPLHRLALPALLLGALSAPAVRAAETGAYDLAVGDPARKGATAAIVLDGVSDTAKGAIVTPAEMASRLAGVRLLLVGESHTNMDFHRAQLRTLEELKRAGRKVVVGLEMFPATEQKVLDRWNSGALDEEAFLKEARWFKNWGYHWDYYREIFLFARRAGFPLVGVNTPREVITAVRKNGFAGLTPEEKALLPEKVDTTSEEHRALFRASFGDDASMHAMMTGEIFEAMFRAQCAWDATMAWSALKALKERGGDDGMVVVLVGEGHVAYGLGIERQAKLNFSGKIATVIPVPVLTDKGKAPKVRASYADFLWGVPQETDPLYPTLGLSTREVPGGAGVSLPVIAVEKEGVAAAAGFQVGDEILAMDGTPLKDRETHSKLMAAKRWGDAAVYTVKRGAETVTLTALFRRDPPKPCEGSAAPKELKEVREAKPAPR